MEMSKKLTVSILLLYMVSVVFSIAAMLIWDKDISNILNYVQAAFMTVLVSYMAKSGAENVKKIGTSSNEIYKKNDIEA